MDKFLLKSENRVSENRGPFSIHHCYDRDKYNTPIADHFKNLVAIKDCEIKPNMGILPHRHQNLELITVPIVGTLVQTNNFGETHLLTPGKVQIMSTGSGVSHFEYNKSSDVTLNCIQFSIIPTVNDTNPKSHYFSIETNKQGIQRIISPVIKNKNLQTYRDFYLHYGFLERKTSKKYSLKKSKKGILILNISGKIEVNGNALENRDTLVLRNISDITINSIKASKFFLFEI